MKNINEIFDFIISTCTKQERNTYTFLAYEEGEFFNKNKIPSANLCLNLKITKNRLSFFLNSLSEKGIKFSSEKTSKYYYIIKISKDNNFIIFDYVVNSHIIIPKSILKHFSKKTRDGWIVSYYSFKEKKICFSKIKEYGTEYGYYDMKIEERLAQQYELQFNSITEKITKFVRGGIKEIFLKKELIHSFLDITVYRRPTFTSKVNEKFPYDNLNHNQILELVTSIKMPHLFSNMEINLIVNRTNKSFLISESLYTTIYVNGNEVIIFPVNPKFCIALMDPKYFETYKLNNFIDFVNIENNEDIDKINKSIFYQALESSEDIIGEQQIIEEILNETEK